MPNGTRAASQIVACGTWTFVNRVVSVKLTMALPPAGLTHVQCVYVTADASFGSSPILMIQTKQKDYEFIVLLREHSRKKSKKEPLSERSFCVWMMSGGLARVRFNDCSHIVPAARRQTLRVIPPPRWMWQRRYL